MGLLGTEVLQLRKTVEMLHRANTALQERVAELEAQLPECPEVECEDF